MFANQGERNPVEFFKLYVEKRPSSLRNSGPLYLSIIDNPKAPDVWYKISRMGIHNIGNFMKGMTARTPLKDLGRKFTNHLASKTSVRKMESSGYVNSHIKNVTGHNNETSLETYDSGDDNEMYGLSCAISNVTPSDQSNKENETSPKKSISVDINVIETGSFQKKCRWKKTFRLAYSAKVHRKHVMNILVQVIVKTYMCLTIAGKYLSIPPKWGQKRGDV